MKRATIAWTAGLALLATAATAPAQNGGAVPPAPVTTRVVQADAIVIGKLGKVEEKNVSATPFPGARVKLDYRVLELRVEEGLRGAKKGDVIRFGVLLLKVDTPGPTHHPGVAEALAHRPGQECLFFLRKHHDQSFYIAPLDYVWIPIDKKDASYTRDLELTRRCVNLLGNPLAGLKAKDAEDRLLAAGMLITRYRHYQPGKVGPETAPIPADENKLILNILADADWPTKLAPGSVLPYEALPGWLFSQLGISFKDGWSSPDGDNDVVYPAAKQWVKAHANTYRIQRFVPIAAAKPDIKSKKD